MSARYVDASDIRWKVGLTKTELEELLQEPSTQKAFDEFIRALADYQRNSEEYLKDLVGKTHRALPDVIKAAISAPKAKYRILYRGDEGKSTYNATSWTTSPLYAKGFGTYVYPFSALSGFEATIDTSRLALLLKAGLRNRHKTIQQYRGAIGDDEGEVVVIGQRWKNLDPDEDYIWRNGLKEFPEDVLSDHQKRVEKEHQRRKKRWKK